MISELQARRIGKVSAYRTDKALRLDQQSQLVRVDFGMFAVRL